MRKGFLISSLISLILLLSCTPKTQKNNLIGVWELARQDDGIESDLMLLPISKTDEAKKSDEPEIILKFNDNSVVDFKQNDNSFKANYSQDKSSLILGTTKYQIVKLSDDSLIIKELDQLMPITFYYIRSNREFKSVKEFEKVEERYPNGQIKIKGTYHNGYEDGLWEEWFENGQKKSEREFKDAMPIGTWKEWNENGELISQ